MKFLSLANSIRIGNYLSQYNLIVVILIHRNQLECDTKIKFHTSVFNFSCPTAISVFPKSFGKDN